MAAGNFFGGQFFGGGFFGALTPATPAPAPSYLGTGSPGGAPGPHSPFMSEFSRYAPEFKQRYPWGKTDSGSADDDEDMAYILHFIADRLP